MREGERERKREKWKGETVIITESNSHISLPPFLSLCVRYVVVVAVKRNIKVPTR